MQKVWKEYFEDLYNTDTLLGFGEATTLEESQLGELRLVQVWEA